ncbi:MAG TPA: hypothetical protein VE196_04905 [Pseudonocardiaceae bacterium]|nr:hypothetical protein [Pseudonocardiaceae bacterium]
MNAVHPAPASVSEAVTAATAGGPGSFQVRTEALLQARNVLQAEHDRLSDLLVTYSNALVVKDCGPDPVSRYASAGFNEKIGLIVQQATAYVQSLKDAADQLDHTVRGYGATDEQISASFDTYTNSHPASPRPASAQYTPARTPGDLPPLANHPPPGPGAPR